MSDDTQLTRVFYDGACPLCHRLVSFAVARDSAPRGALRFSPIGGPTWERRVPHQVPGDTLVALTPQGRVLTRAQAVDQILRCLDAPWPVVAEALCWLPRRLRDAVYDGVANRRRRWFGVASTACPVVPETLRERFEA